jgi:hypothetical protein
MSSPAQVIRRLLIQLNLAPSNQTGDWAPFVAFLPDVPDTALCVYDTAGTQDGRLMRSGEKIEHPGIQIRFRSSNYPVAWQKAKDVADAIDALPVGTTVTMVPATETWRIQNVSRTGAILTAGIEEVGDRKRHNFTINAILTMRKETN